MRLITFTILVVALVSGPLLLANRADAHCDTMDGPVARAGQVALETGKLAPVLRWVSPYQESELLHVFETARALRSRSEDVREVVDMYFLETFVRLHRATEGVPYTGLKPAGTPIAPAIHHAEEALATETTSELMNYLSSQIRSELELRLHRAIEAASHANDSIEHGREWVRAYVEFVHYVEAVDVAASGIGNHAHGEHDPTARESGSDHAER